MMDTSVQEVSLVLNVVQVATGGCRERETRSQVTEVAQQFFFPPCIKTGSNLIYNLITLSLRSYDGNQLKIRWITW